MKWGLKDQTRLRARVVSCAAVALLGVLSTGASSRLSSAVLEIDGGQVAIAAGRVATNHAFGSDGGYVVIHERINGSWESERIADPYSNPHHRFGSEFALSESALAVSSREDPSEGRCSGSHRNPCPRGPEQVFVYGRTADCQRSKSREDSCWNLETILDGQATPTGLPSSLAAEGKTLVIASSQKERGLKLRVFERVEGTWTVVSQHTGKRSGLIAPVIRGNTLVAPIGGAAVFERDEHGWRKVAQLVPPHAEPYRLVTGLAISTDTAVVAHAFPQSADAYVRDSDGRWSWDSALAPERETRSAVNETLAAISTGNRHSEHLCSTYYATSVALDGNRAYVGELKLGCSVDGAAAHVFERTANGWIRAGVVKHEDYPLGLGAIEPFAARDGLLALGTGAGGIGVYDIGERHQSGKNHAF